MDGSVDVTIMTQFLNDWLGLMIDGALIIGIFCLWLTWYRNGQRQQRMEQLLINTAQQLEEATMHLSLATSAIEQIQQQENKRQKDKQQGGKVVTKQYESAQATAQQPTAVSATDIAAPSLATPTPPPTLPPQNSTQATMILRMQREGEPEETIADRLDIPLAQVKLMLKLHAASRSAPI